ncbi:MAG TPA: hypothetical protein VHM48_05560 [Candidatus Limnocylindrales bacterium]|nr:hypothetical protein [Candidatus Limnocylindrales bacterium]
MTWGPAVFGGGTGIVDRDSVDSPSAVEFMREALIKISEEDIGAVAELLARKHRALAPVLGADALASANAEAVRPILARTFATRRRTDEILVKVGAPVLATAIRDLLHGGGGIDARFRAFDEALEPIEAPVRRDLAGECLHFLDPERYWLWSRWMWDPQTMTGALPLVMVDDFDFDGPDAGAVYLRVGAATAAVIATADELGFKRMRASPFVVEVYLAAIYGIYLYTVTRLRMTQEFNRVLPQLPDLVRRLLGVRRLDEAVGHGA